MKNYFFVLALFLSIGIKAQKELLNFPATLSGSIDTYSLIDDANATHLFFMNTGGILHSKIDSTYTSSKKKFYSSMDFSTEGKSIVGHSTNSNGDVILYFANDIRKRYYLFILTKKGEFSVKPINLKLKGESFVQAFMLNGKLRVLAAMKKQSFLKLYSFNEENLTDQLFDFSYTGFITQSRRSVKLSELLSTRISYDFNEDLTGFINYGTPYSLETTNARNKLYVHENNLIIGLDHRPQVTRLLYLNIETGKTSTKNITTEKTVFGEEKPTSFRSNSFVLDKNLYRLVVNKNKLHFNIIDLDTEKSIKSIDINKGDKINFSNSAITQDGTIFGGNRTLETTKQFLRKIASSQLGVSAYKNKNAIEVTMGGIQKLNFGGSGFVANNFFASPTNISGFFSSYSVTKSIFIKALFDDEDFKAFQDANWENYFDRITDFSSKRKTHYETLHENNDALIYGYYEKKSKSFSLVEFKID
ncbi:hypothetical protein [Spongiivirga citrea]|uniref:Uncharacterized protein n=1 Tax=Spongiivirga citrea TaxID=1481457 RepID=A0A6M0CK24_9FLAO|nr:hypothetical protein [Spongiivirga citrea]NER17972.1 hypothetical protein [Spongiivirga citrea]